MKVNAALSLCAAHEDCAFQPKVAGPHGKHSCSLTQRARAAQNLAAQSRGLGVRLCRPTALAQ
eukprot:108933-Amphidinium_carterae.1